MLIGEPGAHPAEAMYRTRAPVHRSHGGEAMEIRSPFIRIEFGAAWEDSEVARLRAQVAWLQAERAALWWAVGHDQLTGLPNRRLLHALAPSLLGEAGRAAVVAVLDLNGFKPINDTFGHDTGDTVLQIIARRLASCVGNNLVARLGGDEFVAVLTGPGAGGLWWQPAVATLSSAVAEPMRVGGRTLRVTASIGVAMSEGEASVGELLRRADLAMYHAKVTGLPHAVWPAEALGRNGYPVREVGPRTVELAVFPAARPALEISTDH
jgi:diguanylate cyclase (GGDEF)-like protein